MRQSFVATWRSMTLIFRNWPRIGPRCLRPRGGSAEQFLGAEALVAATLKWSFDEGGVPKRTFSCHNRLLGFVSGNIAFAAVQFEGYTADSLKRRAGCRPDLCFDLSVTNRPAVHLKKPPIMEMWVEFKFSAPADNWVQPALDFLKECESEYPEAQITGEDKLEFRQLSSKKLPEVTGRNRSVKHLRARDHDGARFLQLTPNQLVCTFLRLGQDYSGFKALSRNAVEKLEHYIRVCNPPKLESVSIHYVDIVEVPVPPDGEINLGDYFTLGLDLPKDVFGHQIAYLVRTALAPIDGTGVLDIQLQMDGVDRDANVFRFRLDWHKICPYDGDTDLEKVSSVLSWGHQSVLKCFRSSFTDRTWALFEPEEE